jgi:ribosomal subunit interface protein
MELRIRNTDLSTVLRSYAERRLRFALSRFGDRAGHVVVTVSGLESADQAIATSCDISADIRPFGQVTARETDRDLYAAIDRAASRLGRLFSSRLGRVKDEGQGPGLTADRTKRRNKKKISGKEPRRLLRNYPLKGSFRRNRGKRQKHAGSFDAEQSNKRRQ